MKILFVVVVVNEVGNIAVVTVDHARVIRGHGGDPLDFESAAIGVRSVPRYNMCQTLTPLKTVQDGPCDVVVLG